MPSPQKEQSTAQRTRSKKQRKGYTGLVNQGATCHLNTVLQMLFMTEEFRKAVERYKPHNDTSNINYHIAELFNSLKPGNRTTTTTERITAELKINVHKQEDAAKCLQKILNMVHPKISEIFQGKMAQITICMKPAKAHEPLEQVKTFFIISISLESQEDHINMQSCFDSYFKPIPMFGEGQQIYCKECEMPMDTEMRCSLQKVPSVLVLHLERFELDYDTMCCVKNHSSVQIPAQLSVKDESGDNHRYDLYAIANHSGSLSGGHYYADIRSFEDQRWYRFNDCSVHQIPGLKCDLNNPLSSEKAYLLLYKKHSGSTEDMFFEDNESERKRANTGSQEDYPKHQKRRRDSEPDGNQKTDHITIITETHPDSQSTADRGIQSPDADTDHQPTPNAPSSHDQSHTDHTTIITETHPDSQSTADRGIQSPDADTDHQPTPNDPSRHDQSHTEHITIITETHPDSQSTADRGIQSPDDDTDHQPTPNAPSRHDQSHTDHITIITETHHDSQSTADRGIQSPDADTDHQPTPNAPSRHDQSHTEHTTIITETHHDSQSTADRGIQSPDADTDHQPTPNAPSRHDYSHTDHTSIITETHPDSQSTADRGIQSPDADTDHQPTPNAPSRQDQSHTDHTTIITETHPDSQSTADGGIQSPDADTDHQTTPNAPSRHDYSHTDHTTIITETHPDSQSTADRGIQSPDDDTDHQPTPNDPSTHDQSHTDHTTIITETHPDSQSTVSDQQDQIINCDFNFKTETKPSKPLADESTPSIELSNHNQLKSVILSDVMDCQFSKRELNNESETGREEKDVQDDLNNSDFNSDTDHQSEPNVSSSHDNRHTEHININTKNYHDSQSVVINCNFNSETEAMLSQTRNDGDGDSQASADRVSEQNKCSDVNVELEPLNEDSKAQANTNNNKTRGACFTNCSTRILLALLIVFLLLIIINVIIFNIVK